MEVEQILMELNKLQTEQEKIDLLRKVIYKVKTESDDKYHDVSNLIQPYLNDKVKSFWSGQLLSPLERIVYFGFVVELTMQMQLDMRSKYSHLASLDFENLNFGIDVYAYFAEQINKAADLGLISTGFYKKPLMIKLAIVSPTLRFCFIASAYSDKPIAKLKKISNFFLYGGELPSLIKDVKWNIL